MIDITLSPEVAQEDGVRMRLAPVRMSGARLAQLVKTLSPDDQRVVTVALRDMLALQHAITSAEGRTAWRSAVKRLQAEFEAIADHLPATKTAKSGPPAPAATPAINFSPVIKLEIPAGGLDVNVKTQPRDVAIVRDSDGRIVGARTA